MEINDSADGVGQIKKKLFGKYSYPRPMIYDDVKPKPLQFDESHSILSLKPRLMVAKLKSQNGEKMNWLTPCPQPQPH